MEKSAEIVYTNQLVIEEVYKMIDREDFLKKQTIFIFPSKGDKLSFRNDNILIKDKDGKIKHQSTCYRLFILFIIGDITITSGIIRRAKKYGFTICMMTAGMKLYQIIGNRMEGNTLLRKKQYAYEGKEIGKNIIINKIGNQRIALNRLRNKSDYMKDAIKNLDSYIRKLKENDIEIASVLGLEGSAARTYFQHMYNNVEWKGRKPRIKYDYVNTTLDIGYNLLFNFIDSILQIYGFDVYHGVLHKGFYMRKSLACDIMEPFRPLIDLKVRKAVNLNQCKVEDFEYINKQWVLSYKKSSDYISFFMEVILESKEEIFKYIQGYYRCFMKGREVTEYPNFILK